MTPEEIKSLGRDVRVLSHLWGELNEGQQRMLSVPITNIESILDKYSVCGVVREFDTAKLKVVGDER